MRWRPITPGKVTIGKLNVDDNPNTAMKFQIRGIPAVLLFKGGQVVETVVGLAPKEDFKSSSTSTSDNASLHDMTLATSSSSDPARPG